MSNQHYFDVPFAFSGDVTAIPDPLQTGGTISFAEGWNYNYQRDLTTDPAALPIDRSTMNWLFLQITTAIQALQGETVPEFITSSQNGGAAYPYGPQAEVLWSASGNAPFTKFVNITGGTNTNTPSATDVLGTTTGWQVACDPIATSAQASAGTNNASIMTPLLVAQQTALRALLAGSATQVFNVGPAVSATQAVQFGQAQAMRGNFNGQFAYPSSQTLTASQAGAIVESYGSATGIVFTLPLAATCPAGDAFTISNHATTTIQVARQGSDVISNGQSNSLSPVTLQPADEIVFISNGSNEWDIVGGSAARQYQALTVGNASTSKHAVALGQFETIAQYQANQSGSLGNPISATTYTPTSQSITFPSFSKTGAFKVVAQLVASGFSQTNTVEAQFQNALYDGTNQVVQGNAWNVYKKNTGYGWSVADTGISTTTYAPGSTVTFTQRVICGIIEDTQFSLQNCFMRLSVIEA